MAQLKSTVVQGALTVTGNVVANKLIKLGGTDDQILMADGTTSSKSDILGKINAAVTIRGTLGTGGTITSLPTASASNLGYGYKVITAGTYNSVAAKIGDMFICYKNGSSYAWMHIPSGDDIEDTWRPIKLEGNQILANGNTTNALNFKAGTNVSISNSSGTITFTATDTGATSVAVTGSGNAITTASYDSSTRKITLTKGATFLTEHQSLTDYVKGPAEATDNAIARFNSTTGKLIQNSTVTIDDSGNTTLPTNATLKLNTYGTRFLTLSGNSITADMSNETGGWAGSFAGVKDPSGTTTTMLGWLGGSTLTHIYMGGAYNDPYMKMTAAGLFTFKNQVTVNAAQGTAPLVVTSTTKVTNLNADLLDGKHASSFALTSDIPDISGFVTGPSSSTDNAIARFNSTTGKVIQNSRATIDDTGNLKINNSDGGDIGLILGRGSNADWRLLGSNGNFYIQDNYTTSKQSSFYDVLTLAYNSGNATVKGSVTANGFKHSNATTGTNDYVLLAGGGTKALSDFSSSDTKVTQSNTTTANWRKVVLSYQDSSTAGTATTSHTNQVYVTPNIEVQPSTGNVRIAGSIYEGGTALSLKYAAKTHTHTKSDITDFPSIPNPTNYYWANVKVSSSSSTATTPSVQKIGITGSTTATATAAVTMEYDSSYKALKFVFA